MYIQVSKLIQKMSTVLLMVLLMSTSLAMAAAPVVELGADELIAFVKQHKTVVVQLNSADPKCGYCVGADKIFDQIAAKRYNKPVVFARVQWALWKDFPKFDPAIKIFGMPSMLFFKNGAQTDLIEGRHKEAAEIAEIEDTVEGFANYNPASAEDTKVLTSPYVIELRPEQFQAFISKHPWAVVQFISSDLNCGYCIGAAYSFNSAAKFRVDKSVPFARVQWPKPWRDIPNFGGAFSVGGIPTQVVFNKGKKVVGLDGKPQDRNAVFRLMNESFEKAAAPTTTASPSAPVNQSTSAITADEQTAIRTMIRFTTYSEAASKCINSKSTVNNEALKSVEDLAKVYAKPIDLAAKSPAKFKTSEDIVRYMKWMDEEKSVFKSWQENTLGIPAAKSTDNDSCVKIIKNAKAFMETKYILN